jgi:beta-glucosidase
LPHDFVIGTATAAFQIEGAATEGGRGVSIWDTYSQTPGLIQFGDDPETGCDHYRLWREDLDLMQSLNLRAYRLNFSWVRLQPSGTGPLNPEGVKFYRELIQGCIDRGITPYVTLYHWDLPQALQDNGGWANRDTAIRFGEYATLVVDAFKDLVHNWITINEAWCVSFLGYEWGVQAPGVKDIRQATRAIHHVLLSHGLAMQGIRKVAPKVSAGITNLLVNVNPKSTSPADLHAAFVVDIRMNRIVLDPLYRGSYGSDVLSIFSRYGLNEVPAVGELVQPGDLEIIATATDFVGINHYTNVLAYSDEKSEWEGVEMDHVEPTRGNFGWSDTPWALRDILVRVNRDYSQLPIFITENGTSHVDVINTDGFVEDPFRIDYLAGYLHGIGEAIAAGVPVKGYFIWSFMDNFEWSWGFEKRFGIVYVDFPTKKRIVKSSGLWLKNLLGQLQVSK